MIKKIASFFCIMSVLVVVLGGTFVYAEELPPLINTTLNPDGSTAMEISLTIQGEDPAQMAEMYRQSFEQGGYTVDYNAVQNVITISQQFPVEDGYFLDLSAFGVGRVDFVEFKDLFSTKYGVKTSALNSEKDQEQGNIYFKVGINTPDKPSFSNATIKDGNYHLWEISSGNKNQINLVFKKINIIPLMSTIFVVLILVVLLYFVVDSRRRRDRQLSGQQLDIGIDDAEIIQEDESNETDAFETEQEEEQIIQPENEDGGAVLSEQSKKEEQDNGDEIMQDEENSDNNE
ncbi:MAG: hypothetical protein GX800_07565 [Clostridiaceae bacterium]|nr:hypothetical protein [Clostridiaceae bacterium]